MIDIHCHILPEVDDGSKSWEMSAEMCRMALADGIEYVVATPHANERYRYDRQYLVDVRNRLQKGIGKSPQIGLGCDFHLSYDNLQDLMVRPEYYTIEGRKYLLVELSDFSIPAQIDECFTNLSAHGITPVLTHPERNPILQRDPRRVLRWIGLGCAVQVTASAVTGFWGETAWRTAQWLLKQNAVHVLATDAHDTKRRVPNLSAAREEVAEVYGAEVAKALVEDNPRAIVQGTPLPYFPEAVAQR
jgi:protein-tyrosine phosphatase